MPATIANLDSSNPYVGRFAPSPTGPLHIGSLICALASYLDAKAHGGRWLLRIEDLDPPREMIGAADLIIDSLKAHGLHWDGEISWQSQHTDLYEKACQTLIQQDKAFYCYCSRSDLEASGGIHRDACSGHSNNPQLNPAIRLKVPHITIHFEDRIQGPKSQRLRDEVGDFVIRRRDSLFAYQLAVVIDDARQGVTHVVRGSDILSSTARQIYLQHQLALTTPHYSHIPIITNAKGQKLSKQNFAPAIDNSKACSNLLAALNFLQQTPPPPEQQESCEAILHWAIMHWQTNAIDAVSQRDEYFLKR